MTGSMMRGGDRQRWHGIGLPESFTAERLPLANQLGALSTRMARHTHNCNESSARRTQTSVPAPYAGGLYFDTVAVACPFCMTMMEDGINARKGLRDIRVMYVSDLLREASQVRCAERSTT